MIFSSNSITREQVLCSSKYLMAMQGALLTIALLSCQSPASACLKSISDNYVLMSNLQEAKELGSGSAVRARSSIRTNLEECGQKIPLEFSVSEVHGPESVPISALDVASVVDSAQLVGEQLNRLDRSTELDDQAKSRLRTRALLTAAQFESLQAVSALLEFGVEPSAADEDGFTALHFVGAQTSNGLATINTLVAGGAELDATAHNVVTPIIMAIADKDDRKIRCLVSLGGQLPSDGDLYRALGEKRSVEFREYLERVSSSYRSNDMEVGQVCKREG